MQIINHKHEDELKAELYHQCKINNLRILLECKVENSRVDAVLVDKDNKIKALIEVKLRRDNKVISFNPKTRQNVKYLELVKKHDIPFIRLSSYSTLSEVIGYLKNIDNAPIKIIIR